MDSCEVPIGWINGNHDPGDNHVVEAYGEMAINLNKEPMYDIISGHSFSQNVEEVREWLKANKYPVTVTHQSASMFMKFGETLRDYQILDKQLHKEDFHAPINFIGDTHVTDIFTLTGEQYWGGEMNCISPGIMVPMRSRRELMEAKPQIMVWSFELEFDTDPVPRMMETANISTIPLKTRPFVEINSQNEIDDLDWRKYDEGIPLLAFVSSDKRQDLDFSKCPEEKIRVVEYASADTADEVLDTPLEDRSADTLEDILAAADDILPEDAPNRGTVLDLTKNMLGVEDPDVIVKNYLEGK